MIEYPTKVLLATDGSEDSARAIEVAVALSGKTGAELHVVHVGQARRPPRARRYIPLPCQPSPTSRL
jgi:nucleotide-binding universal stress UspA family protein